MRGAFVTAAALAFAAFAASLGGAAVAQPAPAIAATPLPDGPVLAVIGDKDGFFFAAENTLSRDGDVVRVTMLFVFARPEEGAVAAAIRSSIDCAHNMDLGAVTSRYGPGGVLLGTRARDGAAISTRTTNEQLVKLYCQGGVEAGWPRLPGWQAAIDATPGYIQQAGANTLARIPPPGSEAQ